MDTDLMMSSQDRHIVYETGGYSPYVSQHSELPSQCAANNANVYYAPHVERELKAPVGKDEDEAVEDCENESGDGYKIDDFSGYYAAPPFTNELPDDNHSVTPLASQSARSINSFPHEPSLQNPHIASMVQGQQQHISSYSGFSAYPHSTRETGYSSNGSESGSQGSFNLQNPHQGYGQYSEGVVYGMPTYDAMNTQSY